MKRVLLSTLIVAPIICNANKPNSPNIILILADDLGWSSLSTPADIKIPDSRSDFHQTPNIDRIFDEGMRFSSGYSAAAVSSPTRYSIQTGQTPARLNHIKVGQKTNHINHETLFSIPKLLKGINSDYICAHFGKWHIDCNPGEMGYDISDGHTTNNEGNKSIDVRNATGLSDPAGNENFISWNYVNIDSDPKNVKEITSSSVNFILEQVRSHKPFYLQLSHYAAHKEIVSTKESYEIFKMLNPGQKHFHVSFAAMMSDLDHQIGRLLHVIDSLKIGSETYVFFMTDNGGVPFFPPTNNPDIIKNDYLGANAPLKLGKWTLNEGGVRIPFAVMGPGVRKGSQCNVPVATYDLLPTFAEIATCSSVSLPENIDGKSFYPLMQGKTNMYDRPLFFHAPYKSNVTRPSSAIRLGKYKLIRYYDDNSISLFNLEKDLSESRDISSENPQKIKELNDLLTNYLLNVNAISFDEMKATVRKKQK